MMMSHLLRVAGVVAAASAAAETQLVFMAGDSQILGYSSAWKLDLSMSKELVMVANSSVGGDIDPAMEFTANAAVCGGTHYSIFWYLVDGDAKHRRYGVGQLDLESFKFNWSFLPAKTAFFGVWCDPADPAAADGAQDLLVVSGPANWDAADDDKDPLRDNAFTVERANLAAPGANWTTSPVAGPVFAPDNEFVPVAEGAFSFDGVSRLWASFSLEHQPGLAHRNAGVIHVLDIAANTTVTHHTKAESGYVMNTQAVPPGGGKTWAVLRRLKKKDKQEVLTLASLDLSGTADIAPTATIADATGFAKSAGLPTVVCNGNVITYNSDDAEWFNLTSFNPSTGAVLWNLDTLTALPGLKYAFTSAFACY